MGKKRRGKDSFSPSLAFYHLLPLCTEKNTTNVELDVFSEVCNLPNKQTFAKGNYKKNALQQNLNKHLFLKN